MKITKKITLAGLGAACALTFSLGVGFISINSGIALAEEGVKAPNTATYFYDNLIDKDNNEYTLAKKFYKALEQMEKDGDFVDGVVDYSLDGIVTSDQLAGWVDGGNLEVPKAFGAARDAFLTDHPELFYINFYKMTISVAKSGGAYVGFINSGREANLYYDNGLNTQKDVTDAIAKFEDRIDEIVENVNKSEENDTYSARDAFLAREVNKYLAENIKYDYVAYENRDDPNYIAAAYINTAYGGLVEGKAVCGGYSTSYKVIMNKLGIPCITVNGYTKNKDQNGKNSASNVYHMWNYVWLETPTTATSKARAASKGSWYSVDVTWDYSAANKYRYAVMNASTDDEIHVTDGVISSSDYRLVYPDLSAFNYGSTGETDGLQYSIIYNREEGDLKNDDGEPLECNYKTVSYNGKSALRLLEEDGLYIAYKYARYPDDDFSMELQWTRWISLATFIDFSTGGIHDETFYIQDKKGNETRFYDNTAAYATQFAVFDVEPDGIDWNGYMRLPYYYSDEFANELSTVASGELLVNQTYGTYTPAPYIQQDSANTIVISDSMRDLKITDKVVCAENKAITFTVRYDEPLHKLREDEPIGITFTSEHPNTKDYAKFFPINGNGDLVELVQGPKSSADPTLEYNTLRFKFGPSLMYEHEQEGYHISFSNVGSAKIVRRKVDGELKPVYSNKVPNPAYYNFGRLVIACPAFFNYDGRLYIDCCAAPTLVSQTDLSAMDFKDEDGNSTFSENERSQMMLVAERAATETVDTMKDEITASNDIGVTGEDIISSETYDIRLQMCNRYPTISDGSYVKIGLGFPEGYGPDDEGVTFKLFHRKHIQGDEYIIEEVPCVVTQFGIVATVTSFSPYMVAVVDAEKATEKTIYASIEGKGGTLTKEDGKVRIIKEGESYTYTIQPNSGYKIYSVTLNGENVLNKVVNGKLTVGYADLGTNNQLVIQYIANEAAERIQKKMDANLIEENVEVGKYVVSVKGDVTANVSMPTYSVTPDDFVAVNTLPETSGSGNGSNATWIAVTVTIVAVVIALGAVVTIVLIRKKQN